MAKTPLTNASIYYGTREISGLANQVKFEANATTEESTTFASAGWKEHTGIVKSANFQVDGFVDYDSVGYPDYTAFGVITTVPLSFTATRPAVTGDRAWAVGTARSSYTNDAPIGLLKFSLTAPADQGGGRGYALGIDTNITTSSNTTGFEVGALSATQKMYVALHVQSGTGAITFRVESDTVGFASPTTRGTFTASAASEYQTMIIAGAVTDTYWRLAWTRSSGTWSAAAFVAIY